jgi:hypothetical protein
MFIVVASEEKEDENEETKSGPIFQILSGPNFAPKGQFRPHFTTVIYSRNMVCFTSHCMGLHAPMLWYFPLCTMLPN